MKFVSQPYCLHVFMKIRVSFTDIFWNSWRFFINKKGFRIAILNYAKLITRPSVSRDFIINEMSKMNIEADMRMAKANKPDFIIVYFDWGVNSQIIPSTFQIDLVKYLKLNY